jgi:hypothetical protein
VATTSLVLRFVHDHLRRRFARFELGAHFLDLRGLLFQLGRESLYLFLQLLNFAIEHRLAFGARATGYRCSRRVPTGIDEHRA